MRLNRFDEIQIEGMHPRNPVTNVVITNFLTVFLVTDDVEGADIPPTALHPRPETDAPIPMGRVRSINWHPIPYTNGSKA